LPRISQNQLESCFYALCDYSIHTHQEDIRQGFVTLRGGHRAGISGSCVWENGQPAGIRDVSSICIRIARQKKGAADRLAAMLLTGEIGGGILIVGAPGSGKTTLLRDLARQLAGGLTGTYYRVAAVDERGELGAAADGVPQNDLGVCCDLLDGFPKGEGIEIAVRTLSPDFILCDELGGAEEIEAVRQSLCRGVRMAASIHATDLDELLARPGVRELLGTGAFSHLILLGKRPGEPFASIPVKEVLI
jgi:stage III sporulation protein AA